MKRGVARECQDGTWVLEFVCTRAEAMALLQLPLDATIDGQIGQPEAPQMERPAQTISQHSVEPGAVHGGSAINPQQERRIAMLQQAICSARVQSHVLRLSGLEGLPADAVQHTSEWLLLRHRARNALELVTDQHWPSVSAIIREAMPA